jgi:glucose-1-phosphate cytidylyltransferase
MKIYSHYGIKDFILCLGYKGWLIKEFFLNYQAMTSDISIRLGEHKDVEFHGSSDEKDWNVTLVDTGEASQTGARLWRVRNCLKGEKSFCFTYGDSVSDINIKKLIGEFNASGRTGMITGVHPAGRFGEIKCNKGLVKEFTEKPNVGAGCVNGGFMVFDNNKIWGYMREGEDLIFEQESLVKMTKDNELAVYLHKGFWQCMDTLREYNILNDMWKNREAAWKIW